MRDRASSLTGRLPRSATLRSNAATGAGGSLYVLYLGHVFFAPVRSSKGPWCSGGHHGFFVCRSSGEQARRRCSAHRSGSGGTWRLFGQQGLAFLRSTMYDCRVNYLSPGTRLYQVVLQTALRSEQAYGAEKGLRGIHRALDSLAYLYSCNVAYQAD